LDTPAALETMVLKHFSDWHMLPQAVGLVAELLPDSLVATPV